MLTREDLKVGETYVDAWNEITPRKVLFITDKSVLYRQSNNDYIYTINGFLKEHKLPEKPKTKWYRVSFADVKHDRATDGHNLYTSEDDFLTSYGKPKEYFRWLKMELVYEE